MEITEMFEILRGDIRGVNTRVERLEEKVDERFRESEQRVNERFERFEEKIDERLERRVESVKADLGQRISDLRTDLGEQITSVQTNLDQRITSVQTNLDQRITDVRTELVERLDTVNDRIAEVRVDIREPQPPTASLDRGRRFRHSAGGRLLLRPTALRRLGVRSPTASPARPDRPHATDFGDYLKPATQRRGAAGGIANFV